MAYNSLLPAELQPMYQQQFGGGVVTGETYPASQLTYYQDGTMPAATVTPAYSTGTYQATPQVYQPPAQEVSYQTVQPQPAIAPQALTSHYNPQPFVPHLAQPMAGSIPPPFKPVLPPIQRESVRVESSPAIMQNLGTYTVEGTLEYGQFTPFGDFPGVYPPLPVTLHQELKEQYGIYPRADVKIVMDNGRYQIYATPIRDGLSVDPLPPIARSTFHHAPLKVRHSIDYPRPLARPFTGYSDGFESVNISRASNFHKVYRTTPFRMSPVRETVVVSPSPAPFEEAIVEEVRVATPPPRVYANYVRSRRIGPSPRRITYRSPTRYTTRGLFQP